MKLNGYQIVCESVTLSISALLISFVISCAVVISIFKLAKRKSKLEKNLTKRIQEITGKKFLKIYIFPFKNKIQAFPSPTGEIFLTERLYNILSEEESLAVALHEAGHIMYQAHLSSILISSIILELVSFLSPYLILALISQYATLFTSLGIHERLADSYAYKQGYGKQLANALKTMIKIAKPDDFNLFGYFGKIISKIDYILHIHPRTKNRIKKLEKPEIKEAINKGPSETKILIKKIFT